MNLRKNQESWIPEIVRQFVVNSSLLTYADLWAKAGFIVTKNYSLTEYDTPPILFGSKPLANQISDFTFIKNQLEEAMAWRLIDLVTPRLFTRQFRDNFDLWANLGFHITPIPVPNVENPDFKPNLFILGAAKSGTTTLQSYLRKIPSVCMSIPKEPFFLEAEYELGLLHYHFQYFRHWNGEPIIGDARHRNLYLPFVAKRIFAINPQSKLVVCVRNPTDRAYSHWWHWYARRVEQLEFEQAVKEDIQRIEAGLLTETQLEMAIYQEALDSTGKGIYRTYIDSGYYYQQISRYMEYFPRNQLKIVLFDDLQQYPYKVLKELESFIGTDYYREDGFKPIIENAYLAEDSDRKRIPILPRLRSFLSNHYQEQNAKLAYLLDRDLSHWQ